MKFYKYEATGNDFLIFKDIPSNPENLSRKICDRRFGFGADGILFPSKSIDADIKMNYYNSDGSLATMCGNGIRAFTKFLLDEKIINKDHFYIETLAGIIEVSLEDDLIKANLGKPILNLFKPFLNKNINGLNLTTINNFKFYLVNTGVLHAVLFKNDNPSFNLNNDTKTIQENPLFINQTNVNLVEIINENTIKVDTFERGSGPTLSCGTGLSGAAYLSYKLNLIKTNKINVLVKGGNLLVEINKDDEILLKGPAKRIGSGNYEGKY
ncbi:MAG: diaminopimelate epimerase [Acholeplasmataceae bacterium]